MKSKFAISSLLGGATLLLSSAVFADVITQPMAAVTDPITGVVYAVGNFTQGVVNTTANWTNSAWRPVRAATTANARQVRTVPVVTDTMTVVTYYPNHKAPRVTEYEYYYY